MTFLPIVQRELRIAARRKSTFRVRWGTALVAIVCAFIALTFIVVSAARGNAGGPLFHFLAWYALLLCSMSGMFLTADCLSQEKREGTIGFLFLTDLRGYDVVLGKFMAVSLNAFYSLLALLPVMALPLLLGGVTGGEFWRTALALANVLFFGLALGTTVSAFMEDGQRAMSWALALTLLLIAGLAVLKPLSPSLVFLANISPVTAFASAFDNAYIRHEGSYWGALACSHLAAWSFLALSSFVLPRSWRERARSTRQKLSGVLPTLMGTRKRTAADAELLSKNPVQWLRAGELGVQWGAWVLVAAWGVLSLSVTFFMPEESGALILGMYGVRPFGFLLKLLFAFQACRFFADARRTGALELLVCTPLTSREIVHGQSSALWRAFLWPFIGFVALLFAPLWVLAGKAIVTGHSETLAGVLPAFLMSGLYLAGAVADVFAICWLGMWLALSMKKPYYAPAATIVAVLVLPSILCWFAIVADLFIISYSLAKLQQDIRWLLSRQYESAVPGIPPLTAASSNAPPVLRV